MRASGCAIVVVSEELDELYQLADRVMVMAGGRLSPSRARATDRHGRARTLDERLLGRLTLSGKQPRSTLRDFMALGAARRSVARWLWLSPVTAIVLTLIAGGILFSVMGTSPLERIECVHHCAADKLSRLEELALKATPLVLCGWGWRLFSRQRLEHRCRRPVDRRRDRRRGNGVVATPNHRACGLLGAAGFDARGRIWASITAWLRDRFNANEILVSLMLVYVAQQLISWLVQGPWRDPDGYGFPQTELFAAAARVPTPVDGSRLNAGSCVALLAAVRLVDAGAHRDRLSAEGGWTCPEAAHYAGFSSRRSLWIALLVSGALAGSQAGSRSRAHRAIDLNSFAGLRLRCDHRRVCRTFASRWIVLASLVMALFYIGGELAQSRLGLPSAFTGVYQGLLLFFLLACDTFVQLSRAVSIEAATV